MDRIVVSGAGPMGSAIVRGLAGEECWEVLVAGSEARGVVFEVREETT